VRPSPVVSPDRRPREQHHELAALGHRLGQRLELGRVTGFAATAANLSSRWVDEGRYERGSANVMTGEKW